MTIAKTESPIETFLLDAFDRVSIKPVVLAKDEAPDIARHAYAKPGTVFMAPQVKVGPYRADFLVAGVFGKYGTRPTVLCVECDGKEFHKGYANRLRDSQRDLWFRKKGIATVRLQGSRLWKDPYACAYEVLHELGIPDMPVVPEKAYWPTWMREAEAELARRDDPDSDDSDRDIE